MTDPNVQSNSSGSRFRVSVWLPALILGGLLIITLTIQMVLSWEAHQRLTPVNRHLHHMLKLQDTNLELQREMVESLTDNGEFTLAERGRMRSEIKILLALKSHLAGNTPLVARSVAA